jgi:hypothetical protein
MYIIPSVSHLCYYTYVYLSHCALCTARQLMTHTDVRVRVLYVWPVVIMYARRVEVCARVRLR